MGSLTNQRPGDTSSPDIDSGHERREKTTEIIVQLQTKINKFIIYKNISTNLKIFCMPEFVAPCVSFDLRCCRQDLKPLWDNFEKSEYHALNICS